MKSIAFAIAIGISYLSLAYCLLGVVVLPFQGEVLLALLHLLAGFIFFALAQVFSYVSHQLHLQSKESQFIEEPDWPGAPPSA